MKLNNNKYIIQIFNKTITTSFNMASAPVLPTITVKYTVISYDELKSYLLDKYRFQLANKSLNEFHVLCEDKYIHAKVLKNYVFDINYPFDNIIYLFMKYCQRLFDNTDEYQTFDQFVEEFKKTETWVFNNMYV